MRKLKRVCVNGVATAAVRGIPYSVFAIVDNQYYDMLQSFGLLRANLKKGVVYARPKYFACRNMFSFFDDGVKPVGMATADFEVLERRIPQVDPPSFDPPSTNAVPYAVNVARFEKAGTPVLLACGFGHRHAGHPGCPRRGRQPVRPVARPRDRPRRRDLRHPRDARPHGLERRNARSDEEV